jgi:hypothetical protein
MEVYRWHRAVGLPGYCRFATKMIFSNYREIVALEEAERCWQIFPPALAENVVTMALAS